MSKKNDDFFKAKKSGQQSKMTFLPAISNHMYPKFFIRINRFCTLTALRGKESLMMAGPVPLLLP